MTSWNPFDEFTKSLPGAKKGLATVPQSNPALILQSLLSPTTDILPFLQQEAPQVLDPRIVSMPGGLSPREAAGLPDLARTVGSTIGSQFPVPEESVSQFVPGGLMPHEFYDRYLGIKNQLFGTPEEPQGSGTSAFADLFLSPGEEGENKSTGTGLALPGTEEKQTETIPLGEKEPVEGFGFTRGSSVTPEMQARWDKAFEPVADETKDGVLDRLADFFAGAAAGSLQGEGLGAVLAGAGAGGLKALSDRKERKRLRELVLKRQNKRAEQQKALAEMQDALNRDHLLLQQDLAEATDRRQQQQLNQRLIQLQMPRYFASGTSIFQTRYNEKTNSIEVTEMQDQLGKLLRLSQIGANQSRIKSPYEGKFVPDKFPPIPKDPRQQPGHIAAVSIMRDNADPELLATARQEATRQLSKEGIDEYAQGFEKTLARRVFDVLRQWSMDPNANDVYKNRLRAVFFRNALGASFEQPE